MTDVTFQFEDDNSQKISDLSVGTYFTISVNGDVLLKLGNDINGKVSLYNMKEKRQYVLSSNIPVVRAFSHVDISLR